MIVEPEPLRGIVLNRFDRVELVLAQPAVADRSVVAFDVGILLWIAWLDEFQLDVVPVRPHFQVLADELRAVVGENPIRMAPIRNYAIKHMAI